MIAARVLGHHIRQAELIPEHQACLRSLGKSLSWTQFLHNLVVAGTPDSTGLSRSDGISLAAPLPAKQNFPGALSCLLVRSNGCQSTLDLDRIYALVGMAETVAQSGTDARHKQSYTFEIDYKKTVQEAFTDFARLVINTLGLIWILDRNAENAVHSDLGLPSWVPDYRHPPPPPEKLRLLDWYRWGLVDEEIHFAEPSILVINGVHFATVADETSSALEPVEKYTALG